MMAGHLAKDFCRRGQYRRAAMVRFERVRQLPDIPEEEAESH